MKILHFISLVIVYLSLSACSDGTRQRALTEELTQIKRLAATESSQSLELNFQLPKPVTYPPNSPNVTATNRLGSSDNPLENYPLKSLRFAGTVTQGEQISAYILTPDNMMFPVKVGDKLGTESGKVIKIEPSQVEISVNMAVPGQPVTSHILSLQLKE